MSGASGLRRVGRRQASALRSEWRELGGLGRLGLVGVTASSVVAVGLGFWIPKAAEQHLLTARGESITRVVDDLTDRGLVPLGSPEQSIINSFDDAIRLRLLGGDTVRVKVWSPDGTIVYSDVTGLIDETFEFDNHARSALSGSMVGAVSDLSRPENVYERGMGELIEYYVPVSSVSGEVIGLFEVYQSSESLRSSLTNIRRNVWFSIGSGLGFLALFMGSLTLAHARILNRRRRQAENLVTALVGARDEERRKVVGALHDGVGQPLYRLLYGLQGSRKRVEPDHPVASELARLEELVREADSSLRSELRELSSGLVDQVGLEAGIRALVDVLRRETDLDVAFNYRDGTEPSPGVEDVLYRVAREALINVQKHALANTVEVDVRDQESSLVLTVQDDGVGFDGSEGLGLATARERLEAMGGRLQVRTSGHGGTILRASVPETR